MLSEQLLGKKIEGVWHTSIHVHGKEYWFGHGMQVGLPRQTQFGTPKEVLQMGETEVDEEMFQAFLDEVHPRFNVGTYSLLEHNCNNFSDEVCEFLVGKKIPQHIVSLPSDVLDTPFGQAIKPMLQVFENRMRNTRGQTVFKEDADDISEGICDVTDPHAVSSRSEILGNSNRCGLERLQQRQPERLQQQQADLSPLFAMGLQALAQGLANAQQGNRNNNINNNNNNNNARGGLPPR